MEVRASHLVGFALQRKVKGDGAAKRSSVRAMVLEVGDVVGEDRAAGRALQEACPLATAEHLHAVDRAPARHASSDFEIATAKGSRPSSSVSVRPSTWSTASTLSNRTVGLPDSSS